VRPDGSDVAGRRLVCDRVVGGTVSCLSWNREMGRGWDGSIM
jgi:hypothetical protein